MATTLSSARLHASGRSMLKKNGVPGAPVSGIRPVPSRQPTLRTADLFALAKEPEDASLTGGTRSLDRRLLALNISGSLAKLGATVSERLARSPQPTAA